MGRDAKPIAGEEGPEMIAPRSKVPGLSEERPLLIDDDQGQISSSRFGTGDLDAALNANAAKVADLSARFAVDRTQCQACGSDALPFDHPQGFYACGRCGTLQQNPTTLRADYEAKVAALASGGLLTINGPFRGMRNLATLRMRTIEGSYLLERSGATLLMLSLGMALRDVDDSSTLTFIKG